MSERFPANKFISCKSTETRSELRLCCGNLGLTTASPDLNTKFELYRHSSTFSSADVTQDCVSFRSDLKNAVVILVALFSGAQNALQ